MPPYSLSSRNGLILEFHSGSNEISRNRGFHFWFKYVREDDAMQALPVASSASHAQINSSELCESIFCLFCAMRPLERLMPILLANYVMPESLCPVKITSPSMSSGSESFTPTERGTINSSLYSVHDEPFKCQFIFMGSSSERVHIAFLQFNLFARIPQMENRTMRCDEVDHVTVHVLIGTRMSRVDDFCGSETPPKLMSTKNLMTLEYVVRSTKALRQMMPSKEPFGFALQYEFRTDLGLSDMNAERSRNHVCYYLFNSSRRSSGSIFSPNHPGYYPRNIDCHYVFHGTEKQIVIIHFEYFDVEGFSTCDDSTHSDYVLFSNYQTHDRTNRRYCGQVRPQHSIISESNYFRMVFKSNDIFDATGFFAHYQFITQQTSQINRVKITNVAQQVRSKCLILIAAFLSLHISRLVLFIFSFLGGYHTWQRRFLVCHPCASA
ncbi:Suppressor of lurcher protein 1 [Toxocara canis]|uniref:Suppressor of lurcher protein 1 n=1 Tax=Toxocara canis TaxID=6265 RepID=A0A0B2UY04_TOXCA|nr:Suppressor of lurcher protein 1 [Toxocara canis]